MMYGSLVLGALLLYMAYRPKRREPTRLKFRSRNMPSVAELAKMSPQERELTALFQFNGHTFEAHEVLDITPGSDRGTIEQAYKRALLRIDSTEAELFDLAYKTLIVKKP